MTDDRFNGYRYKSSVLRCCQCDDDDCAVCQFLNGSGHITHMLKVIKVLDEKLAEAEKMSRKLAEMVHAKIVTKTPR